MLKRKYKVLLCICPLSDNVLKVVDFKDVLGLARTLLVSIIAHEFLLNLFKSAIIDMHKCTQARTVWGKMTNDSGTTSSTGHNYFQYDC